MVRKDCIYPKFLFFGFLNASLTSTGASETSADNLPYSLLKSSCVNKTIPSIYASSSPQLGPNFLGMPKATTSDYGERRRLLDEQKTLHLHLKPEISKLCEILQLNV